MKEFDMMQLILALCALLLASTVAADPLPMQEAAPGVYVHHGVHEELDEGYHGDICNIGFIVGKTGVAVIDSGGSLQVGKRLREAVRKVTDLPIRYVVNTHIHPDHIFGNAAFKEDRPVYVGHAKLADAMERRRDIYLRNNAAWLGEAFAGSEIIKPTQAVETAMQLDLGERALLLTAYPAAHTNTDLTVFDTASATLWSGDLLFIERTPSIDGDVKGWLKVIAQLRAIKAQRVIPGHGPVTGDWQAALDKEQHYFDTLLGDIRASIKQGATMEQAMNTAAASEKGNWVLFENVNRRNINIVYPVLEWD